MEKVILIRVPSQKSIHNKIVVYAFFFFFLVSSFNYTFHPPPPRHALNPLCLSPFFLLQ